MDNDIERIFDKILDKVPRDVDFGFVAVKNEITKTIHVENITKFQIPFEFVSSNMYKFNPSEGNLPRNGKIEILRNKKKVLHGIILLFLMKDLLILLRNM